MSKVESGLAKNNFNPGGYVQQEQQSEHIQKEVQRFVGSQRIETGHTPWTISSTAISPETRPQAFIQ